MPRSRQPSRVKFFSPLHHVGGCGEDGSDHHEFEPFSAAPNDQMGLEEGRQDDWADGRGTATPKVIELLLDEADIPFRQRAGLPNLHYLQDDLFQPAPLTGSSSRDNGDAGRSAEKMATTRETQRCRKRRPDKSA